MIESVVEDLAVKRALFAELDRHVKPSAILATNTSTLPVVELAMATGRPPLVCGIHFFNPAPVMKLVEVVRPLTASDETITAPLAFAERCGKEPIEVKDHAGFVVNALLFPYLNNAVRMLERGTAELEAIDTAMVRRLRLPDGPDARCSTWSASTPRWRSSRRCTPSSTTPSYAPAPTLAAGRSRAPGPQDRPRVLHLLSPLIPIRGRLMPTIRGRCDPRWRSRA